MSWACRRPSENAGGYLRSFRKGRLRGRAHSGREKALPKWRRPARNAKKSSSSWCNLFGIPNVPSAARSSRHSNTGNVKNPARRGWLRHGSRRGEKQKARRLSPGFRKFNYSRNAWRRSITPMRAAVGAQIVIGRFGRQPAIHPQVIDQVVLGALPDRESFAQAGGTRNFRPFVCLQCQQSRRTPILHLVAARVIEMGK